MTGRDALRVRRADRPGRAYSMPACASLRDSSPGAGTFVGQDVGSPAIFDHWLKYRFGIERGVAVED